MTARPTPGTLAIMALAVLACLAWASTACATIAIKFDLAALTSSADEVVLARVETSTSHWEGGRIVTDVDVRVALPVLGQAQQGQRLRVRSLGGRVGDLAQVVQGSPHFTVGDEVLLFLERKKSADTLRVVGLSQGRYRLFEGPDAALWGAQDLQGLTLATPTGKDEKGRTIAAFDPDQGEASTAVPLQVLLREVAASAQRLDLQVRPEITTRLGEDLSQAYDLKQDFIKIRSAVAPAPSRPVRSPEAPSAGQPATF